MERRQPVGILRSFISKKCIPLFGSIDNIPIFLYLLVMKTTIDFPDQLFHDAKVTAAKRRTTFRELAIQGLKIVTSEDGGHSEELARKEKVKQLLKAMKASNVEPMKPLTREEIYDR